MNESEKSAFSTNLCNLMKSKGLKAQQLGEAIGISRQTITQYMNDEIEPKMRAFKVIADYFNVSCDYLLGRSRVAAPDETLQAVFDKLGLSDESINELSNMPTSSELTGIEYVKAMERQAETMAYRAVINLLLSRESGKKALKLLALYYFARLDGNNRDTTPGFVIPWKLPDTNTTWLDYATLDESFLRELPLKKAKDELKGLQMALRGGEPNAT